MLTEPIAASYADGRPRPGGRRCDRARRRPRVRRRAGRPAATVLSAPARRLTAGLTAARGVLRAGRAGGRVRRRDELRSVLAALEGALAGSVFGGGDDDPDVAAVVDLLAAAVGRVIVDDWPTGVAVTWAQQHGGPWPATSVPSATSVGAAALDRFTRPVTWQGVPDAGAAARAAGGEPVAGPAPGRRPPRGRAMSVPLDGVMVADFSRVLAGPLATMTLADLGADVVKVERPGTGDDTRHWGPPWHEHGSSYFESVNRSKRSIALDLRDAGDLAVARRLADRADVVVENFLTGTMDRLRAGLRDGGGDQPGPRVLLDHRLRQRRRRASSPATTSWSRPWGA